MALVLKDRVKETSITTGTSDIVLAGSAGAYQAFSVIGDGNQTYYAIAGQTTSEWEVGIGTYTLSSNSISRDTILSSSNSNAIVTFSAGTKDVFCTYPSEKAIYEEPSGETLINAGPITVIGAGVTSIPSLPAELGKFVGDVNSFAQIYTINQNDGATASADFVAYNDLTTDGYTYFTDMGISSSNYTSLDYPIFTPNSGYVFHQGGDFFIGNQTTNKDIKFFSGGVDVTDLVATFSGTDRSASFEADVSVGGSLDVTGAAAFGSTVLLNANPTLALQAATKQYVDNQVTAGLHIHDPVRVETTGNLTATYVQGGTTFNITDITSTTTVTTSVNHGLSVNDQIWLTSTAGNGLSINTAYFVYSTPALNQLTLSLTFGGAQITGLTNASGLTYATRANSGVGATLTNAGTQVALTVDGIALSVADRVMVRLQTNGEENGVYVVTTVGSGSTNWVLTRSNDANMVNPSNPDGLGTGDYFFTQEGVINAGDSHVLTTEPNTMIIGYTPLTYTQFSGGVTYTGGTNIDVTGQVISLTGTVAATNGGTGTNTATTGDLLYGSATNTWSKLALGAAYKTLSVNAGGTQVEWNAVALDQSAAVSGSLGPTNGGTGQTGYTLGDLIYSSATDTLARLAGNTTTTKQYLSQTGTGSASTAPSWATIDAGDIGSGTLAVARGGTNIGSYAIGDLIYASGATTLSKLASAAAGTVLISNGLTTAPSWSSSLTLSGAMTAASYTTGGNLTFTGTGNRIIGDFSNATHVNRVSFQTSTTNGATSPFIIPNGTGTTASIVVANASDPTNSSYGQFLVNNTDVRILSGVLGTGTFLPIAFHTGGSERIRIDTSGNVGIGTTSIVSRLHAAAVGGTVPTFTIPDATNNRYSVGIGSVNVGGVGQRMDFYAGDSGTNGTNLGSGALRMSITATGDVGIGTSSPGSKLDVVGGSIGQYRSTGDNLGLSVLSGSTSFNSYVRLSNGTQSVDYGQGNGQAFVNVNSSQPWVVLTSGSERMRINASGNVSIGSTADTYKLDVTGTSSFSDTMKLPSSWGSNYILAGTGDGADFNTYNIAINSWWGIGFRDYQNLNAVKAYIDCRTGNIGSQGSIIAGGNRVLGLTLMTETSATGTSVQFTGIPSWVRRITVMFSGVSSTGTSSWLLQLGTSSGYVTTGYVAYGVATGVTGLAGGSVVTGICQFRTIVAAQVFSGLATITTLGNNKWVSHGMIGSSTGDDGDITAGGINLAGTLDRIRLIAVNGTDNFDAGSLNVMYE